VKRGKSDRIDAEAMCEAMSRPSMSFVPVRSEAQQTGEMLLTIRDLLIKQRTMLINAIRGHAAEFGVTAARGAGRVEELLAKAEEALSPLAFALLSHPARLLEAELKAVDKQLAAWHRNHEASRRLAGIPGIGPGVSLYGERQAFAFRR
jgi:transposase